MRPPKSWRMWFIWVGLFSTIVSCLTAFALGVDGNRWEGEPWFQWKRLARPESAVGICLAFGGTAIAILGNRWVLSFPHRGWRRASIVLSPIASALASWLALGDHERMGKYVAASILCLFFAAPVLLALSCVCRWVKAGFDMHGPPKEGSS